MLYVDAPTRTHGYGTLWVEKVHTVPVFPAIQRLNYGARPVSPLCRSGHRRWIDLVLVSWHEGFLPRLQLFAD
jgi:hypothetical protein